MCRLSREKSGQYGTELFPIHLRSETWKVIAESFQLPTQHLEIMKREGATFFDLPLSSGTSKGMRKFVIQSHLSKLRGLFSAAFTIDGIEGTTQGFIHGLETNEVAHMLPQIKHAKESSHHPTLVPLLLVEARLEETLRLIDLYQQKLWVKEDLVGLHPENTASTENSGSRTSNVFRSEEMLRELSSNAIAISFFASVCKHNVHLTQALEKLLVGAVNDESPPHVQHTHTLMQSKVASFIDWIEGLDVRCVYLTERMQSVTQMTHVLMSQRDNNLNKKLGFLAARDSALMKVIATITMIFLPGTFTATMFSTSFFDFQSENMSLQWQWLYWLITAVLTIIVYFASWRSYGVQKAIVFKRLRDLVNDETGEIIPRSGRMFAMVNSWKVKPVDMKAKPAGIKMQTLSA